ncbi:pilus assembly PilX N-terminal domain-containing protein [Pseudomonas stutzeri]|uniref:Type 4 fimbrial biogenesis protein PilX N-terminal domain-containing protein n=1 Tax=Stutzerimonas stutzeri TaxID=316 RepID=A0A2N8S501_STUST|nr:PilX N-terminal domain-containing pilus assembly protein [Stutzerimonas stutzeri]MCQ4296824.1 pilus assembly PilX N-terminal domain-containing protein [Stutzerimonas stutzeri]PNF81702.1 hypothetical protein CXK92_07710 [Stutzerimonas stutzeri]
MNASESRGFALITALIMLLLLTVMVTSSYTLTKVNLDVVGNQQWRNEALAAADNAIEQVIPSLSLTTPSAQTIGIDINRDGADDYEVALAAPQCLRTSLASAVAPSSLTLEGMSSSTWNTEWELVASVLDPGTGASVRVRSGIRLLLSDARKNQLCP